MKTILGAVTLLAFLLYRNCGKMASFSLIFGILPQLWSSSTVVAYRTKIPAMTVRPSVFTSYGKNCQWEPDRHPTGGLLFCLKNAWTDCHYCLLYTVSNYGRTTVLLRLEASTAASGAVRKWRTLRSLTLALMPGLCYDSRMISSHFPTEAAKRIFKGSKLSEHFDDEERSSEFVADDALAHFQRMVISGTDVELAKKVVFSYLKYDPQNSEDQLDEVKSDLGEVLDLVKEITVPEGKSLIVQEVLRLITAQGMFDGKVKLEATRLLNEFLDGKGPTNEESRGLLLRLAKEEK